MYIQLYALGYISIQENNLCFACGKNEFATETHKHRKILMTFLFLCLCGHAASKGRIENAAVAF